MKILAEKKRVHAKLEFKKKLSEAKADLDQKMDEAKELDEIAEDLGHIRYTHFNLFLSSYLDRKKLCSGLCPKDSYCVFELLKASQFVLTTDEILCIKNVSRFISFFLLWFFAC